MPGGVIHPSSVTTHMHPPYAIGGIVSTVKEPLHPNITKLELAALWSVYIHFRKQLQASLYRPYSLIHTQHELYGLRLPTFQMSLDRRSGTIPCHQLRDRVASST